MDIWINISPELCASRMPFHRGIRAFKQTDKSWNLKFFDSILFKILSCTEPKNRQVENDDPFSSTIKDFCNAYQCDIRPKVEVYYSENMDRTKEEVMPKRDSS